MKRRWLGGAIGGAAIIWSSAGLCAEAPAPAAPIAAPLAATDSAAPVKTVALARLVIRMAAGTPYAVLHRGVFCVPGGTSTWPGGQADMKVAMVIDTFRATMKAGGLHPEEEASLFDAAGASPSEYALAGVITNQHFDVCGPDINAANKVKGQVDFTIDWQLYSRLEKQVVATVHTTGSFSSTDVVNDGLTGMMNKAFAENVKQFAADATVRKLLSGAGLGEDELVKPPQQALLAVPGVLAVKPRPIDKAAESVVVIYSGNTLGSGFLISPEGYILTDAHVVGDAKAVRLRWSDGKEGTATVERVSKERDVALVKTDPGAHLALPLSQAMPETGSTVFAIGAPEGQRFEGTVTRGVVSASRVFQGFNYIQSDVTTGHGGSGGPLLDEAGRVVGMTEMGLHNETTSGLNFFNPVKDAIAFLGLDLR